jgi:hypothetical protein
LGHENATAMVVEYDKKLLLPLLMMANKLLMLDKVEEACNLHSQVDSKGLFHTTITNTYMDIVSRELVGF